MKKQTGKAALAILVVMCVVQTPMLGFAGEPLPLGKAVPRGVATLNQTPLLVESTLYAGDRLATTAEGTVAVFLSTGDRVQVGPESTVQLGEAEGTVVATLEQGSLLAQSENGQSLFVRARGLRVSPEASTRYQVALLSNGVLVASEHGAVVVQGTNRSYTVAAGKAMKFEVASSAPSAVGAGPGANSIGPAAATAIAIAVSVGVAVPTSVWYANKKAEDACEDAIQAVSPSASTAGC